MPEWLPNVLGLVLSAGMGAWHIRGVVAEPKATPGR